MSTKRSPELDNAPVYQQDSLLANLPIEIPPTSPGPTTFHPPVDVERKLKAQAIDDEREWERIDNQAQTSSAGTRQKVGQTMLAGADIERSEVKSILKNANLSKPRPKKDRRHLSPRGKMTADQAPPHVVRELRGEL
jgi:hypothetical protein